MMAREHDISRLDIPIHNAVLMRIRERAEYVSQNANGFRYRKRTAGNKPPAQRLAFDERHRVVRKSFTDAGRKYRNDAGVLELRCDLHFPPESLEIQCCGEIRREQLDDDLSPERYVLGDEEPGHARARELTLYPVLISKRSLEAFGKLSHNPTSMASRPRVSLKATGLRRKGTTGSPSRCSPGPTAILENGTLPQAADYPVRAPAISLTNSGHIAIGRYARVTVASR